MIAEGQPTAADIAESGPVEISPKEVLTTVNKEAAGQAQSLKKQISTSYLKTQQAQASQQILNPSLLTKELDAYYHIFIERFQQLEKELKNNQISDGNIIEFLKSASIKNENRVKTKSTFTAKN